MGFLYVLHDTVYIVMYSAAEILALLHMDCVQQIGGLVMLPGWYFSMISALATSTHAFRFWICPVAIPFT